MTNSTSSTSRRKFIQTCAWSAAALAASPVLMSRNAMAQPAAPTGPARLRFSLDQNWRFGGRFTADALRPAFDDAAFEKITLPHCVSKLSWQGWHPSQWQDVWVYRRHFATRPEFKNRRVFLDFDGVMNTALPVFNGKELPPHQGGYLPFHYEITGLLNDGDNVLALFVDSRWNPVPPEGNPKGTTTVDYLEPGGITRSVALRVVPPVFISDVFAKPVDVLRPDRHVEITCTIDAGTIPEKPLQLKVEMFDGDRRIAVASKDLLPDVAGEAAVALKLSDLGDVKLWDVDAPQLYRIVATLMLGGEPLHDYQTRIGLREARFDNDGFYLNDRRLRFMGLDRHEVYPYTGFAMPARVMRRDAEMIKREFNCNAVRCSHYPQNEAFLDACDELGLLVWQETPGWQFIGDDAWKDLVVRDVQTMIRRDRNHPSIFIWGVRVNESRNDIELFQRTTAAARALDDSRPASGSMTAHSTKNWQEDIFSLDDYHSNPDGSVGIDEPLPGVPYMLSETVGQFSYGAKKGFNNKYRRAGDLNTQTSQALYHAQAHDRAAAYPRFSGVIAWCAFDYSSLMNAYNAVKCPGIADVFRIPKLGATFYQSQVAPGVRPVILPDFYWDFGGHSPDGPGKSSAIFSNCERLEVFVDGKSLASLQPDRANYPNLKYPPFFCDLELDGGKKPELRIDGYVGDKLVLTKSFSSDAGKDQLFLAADDAEITGDGSDATRLVFKVVDQFGAERAFGEGQIVFEITGPGVIVGDNPFTLLDDSGGVGAVWIKTLPAATGSIVVKAVHSALGEQSVNVNVKPASSLDTI
ncbi:MAG TPA: glycoside hydrolase family 2 TIM barrel-domain containing protein [Candidatus Sulfotelmatobacter sp.]|nr:glycoside hydrolase family 2 TIM barrel-domain containing protein [Candidatus Sulfotelmatobacter sp.]